MGRAWSAAVLALSIAMASDAAQACMMSAPLVPEDVKFADVVVIGRITNYQIVLDQEFRRQRGYNNPEFANRPVFMSDYVRFEVSVDEVLVGEAPRLLTVTWDNSTFGEPETMATGPYLLALRRPSSNIPPLRGPSATITPSPEPASLTVLQAPCAPAFILESSSKEAATIRKILAGR